MESSWTCEMPLRSVVVSQLEALELTPQEPLTAGPILTNGSKSAAVGFIRAQTTG